MFKCITIQNELCDTQFIAHFLSNINIYIYAITKYCMYDFTWCKII